MRTLFITLVFTICFIALPSYSQEEAREKIFNAESFTLDNGMQVVVIPNHRAPVVTHMVWYKVGASDEPRGQSGIAHFVEHLMFKGSENVASGAFSKRVRALGGNDNAFTNKDYTAYYQSIAAEHLETVMTMEADRMKSLLFPPEDVLSERDVVIEERRQRTDNDPRGYFGEQMRAALFVNHPYGIPVIGWFHEVDALNRDYVQAFYKEWYSPSNAVLVIAGNITAADLKPLAEKTYGAIPARAVPERIWTKVPPMIGLPRMVLHHETIRQPLLQRLYRVPSFKQNKIDSYALQVLENIMSGGSATRLYKALVVDQKIAVNADLSYQSSNISDGVVSVGITPAEDTTLENLEIAFDKIMQDVIKNGVTEQELREAKNRLKDEAIFARDSLQGPAMVFGSALTTGATIDDVEYWPHNIEAVTAMQIQDVAARYLDNTNYEKRPFVTGYLLPPQPEETTTEGEE